MPSPWMPTGGDRNIGDDVILRTPGLEGEAEARRPSRPGERGCPPASRARPWSRR